MTTFGNFDTAKNGNTGKVKGKRERSQSSFWQEIIGGFQEQHNEEIKHEFEEYDNIDIDDICLDITIGSINEMMDIKNKVKDGVDAFQNMKAVSIIRQKKEQLENALKSTKNIRTRDRYIFVYCSIVLHALVYLLGSHPGYLFLYAMALSTVGFFWTRVYLFTMSNKLSWITDFPYFCSIIFALWLVHFPHSQTLYMFCYCASLGSLSISVYYLMNSMVMHKLNSIADLFIKIGPLIVMWNVHWNIRDTPQRQFWGFYDGPNDELTFDFIYNYLSTSTLVYLFWAIPYASCVAMDSQKYGEIPYLKQMGLQGKLVYLIFHYLLFIGAGSIIGITAYFYQPVHILTIIMVACTSFWNGGKYYMDYFGQKYELNISMLEKEDKQD